VSTGFHTVHVRVNDAATGQPTPVRIRFTDATREEYPDYFPPFGRLGQGFVLGHHEDAGGNVRLGLEEHAYIDGSCEIRLPATPISIQISKGFEYKPVRQTVVLGPGKLALRLNVERWIDLRQQRWYSGDTSVLALTPHAALLEGAAEDLAVINLLSTELRTGDPQREPPAVVIPNIVAFSGQRPLLEMPGHMLVVNTLNSGGQLGTLGLLNCHRIVYPLSIGWTTEGVYNWTLADWCDQCHRKGGLVLWAEFGRSWEKELGFASEALADLILGRIDAVEVDRVDWSQYDQFREWYRFLNAGFRVPLAGGSAKISSWAALGSIRTYARLQPGEEFTYKNWIESLRAGRTFVTNGPLLTFTVNDQDPGAILHLPSATPMVHVRAEARSILPFDRLEVVAEGTVIASAEASGSPASAAIEMDLPLQNWGWLAARCHGQQELETGHVPQRVGAHTSPVYLQVGDKSPPADATAIATLLSYLDTMLEWVRCEGRFENDRVRDHLAATFESARQVLIQRAGGEPGGAN
jgi:hypothetical protein